MCPLKLFTGAPRYLFSHLLSGEAFSGYSVADCASPQRESVRHTHHRRRNSPRIAQVSDTAGDFVDLIVVCSNQRHSTLERLVVVARAPKVHLILSIRQLSGKRTEGRIAGWSRRDSRDNL